jgi:hypothetical protein
MWTPETAELAGCLCQSCLKEHLHKLEIDGKRPPTA